MKSFRIYFLLVCLFASLCLKAQLNQTEALQIVDSIARGNYVSYYGGTDALTPAPEGYQPFYISHYGRHGSRFLTSNKPYHHLIDFLEKAKKDDALTELGQQLLPKLRIAYAASKGKSGMLTRLGGEQHEQIAHRMFCNFPEVFANGHFVDARSTVVPRTKASMEHFCAELNRLNPQLDIRQRTTKEDAYFMKPNTDSVKRTPQQKAINKLALKMQDSLKATINISQRIFKDPAYVTRHKQNHSKIAYSLFEIYRDMACLPELGLDFNIFTPEELFTYFKFININWMERTGVLPGSEPIYKRIYATLKNIITWADIVIQEQTSGASLRFGHDTQVFPLAYILQLDGCTDFPVSNWEESYRHFSACNIVPMAGNIQIIFYRKDKSNDILVKFLLQEKEKHIPVKTDIWPYYHWKDVRKYYMNQIRTSAASL